MSDKHTFTYEHGGAVGPKAESGNVQTSPQISDTLAQSIADARRVTKPEPKADEPRESVPARDEAKIEKKAQGTKASSTSSKKSGAKKTQKRKGRGWLAAVAVVLIIAVTGTALQLTGTVNFAAMISAMTAKPAAPNTYVVDSDSLLIFYLSHPSLKPGDTLELSGSFVVDVRESFGGFTTLPVVNFGGSGNVTFSGGTMIITGDTDSADMSRASFDGVNLYIDAPNTDLKLGSADDTNINAQKLNGTAHTRALEIPMTGARMTVPVTFTNHSSATLTDVVVNLSSAGFLFIESDQVTIPSIPAGGDVTVDVPVVAAEAGRVEIFGYALNGSNQLVVTGQSGYINIYGAGYYAGDPHTHTEESESIRYGTLEENIRYGYQHGMSYIVSVEIGTEAEPLSQGEVDALTGGPNSFYQFVGGETDGTQHLLILNSEVRPNSNYGETIMNHGTWIYQDAVNEVLQDGGLVILPHFLDFNFAENVSVLRSVRGATAMEILTLGHKVTDTDLVYYLNAWANQNVLGRGKLFGIFSSNNVTSDEVGTRYIKGYMPVMDEDNFYAMMASGNYFMSNGPELRFSLGGVSMGGDLNMVVPAEPAEGEEAQVVNSTATARFHVSDTSAIVSIRLLRYGISGKIDSIEADVVYEEDFTGQGVYSIYRDIDVELVPDSYYRLEVKTENARYYDDEGLALSNPVYVHTADYSNFTHIEQLNSVFGAAIEQAPNGMYYIRTDKAVAAGNINVKTAGDKGVAVVYHAGGDVMADYITVTILTEDGTRVVERIYILN